MRVKKSHLKIFVGLLLVTFVGATIIRIQQENKRENKAQNNVTQKPTPAIKKLSEKELMALFRVPLSNASEDEKNFYTKKVLAAATRGTTLQITNCKADPLILKIKPKDALNIVNKDATEHTLTFTFEHIYTIPAKGEKTIIAEFDKGNGIYNYGCDEALSPTGLLVIMP